MSRELGVPAGMRSFRFPAMGTEVHVLLPTGRRGAVAVRELFFEWEARLSRFLPGSRLSRLNARAGTPVVADPLLYDVVEAAIGAAHATDGAFDPTLLHQLERIGYRESFRARATASAPAPTGTAEPGGRWRGVALDPYSRTITLPDGCALDLGGIAKGMAVDAALDLLAAHEVEDALVSAGGDLAVRGLPAGAASWDVLVGEAEEQVVPLVRGALATSGVARRSWEQAGIRRHHLLDPSTGEPAQSGLREVTVAAGSCRVAEVAATATFVLGEEAGSALLRRHRLAGLLTRDDGSQMAVGRWPSPVADAA